MIHYPVWFLNGVVSVLCNVLDHRCGKMLNESYVDDMTLITKEEGELQKVFDVFVIFLKDTQQNLDVGKTYVFGVGTNAPTVHVGDKK